MPLLLTLQKTLSFLLMPAGLLWLGALLLTFHAWRRGPRKIALALSVGTLAYTLAGNVHVGYGLMRVLERQVPVVETGEPFDAVCVFGGGTELDEQGQPQLASSGDRVRKAAQLYHAGKARLLVASGVSFDDPRGPRNLGNETRQLWLELGIPDAAIRVVEQPCRVTREEVAAFQQLQAANQWQRVAFVSSTWHLPRILRLARRQGMSAIPVGSDSRAREHTFAPYDVIPQGAGLWRVNIASWELLGSLAGR